MNDEGFSTTCVNCGRESHLLGSFCWWGVWMTAAAALLLAAMLAYLAA